VLEEGLVNAVSNCAREFDAGAVWLFGSALEDESRAHDIDLAVDGIPPERFFKFYFRLILALPKPVDLVDLSLDPLLPPSWKQKGFASMNADAHFLRRERENLLQSLDMIEELLGRQRLSTHEGMCLRTHDSQLSRRARASRGTLGE